MKTQKEILAAVCDAGAAKASMVCGPRGLGRLVVLSVMAGAFIALGGALSVIVGFGFPSVTAVNPGLQRLLSALVFPVGLVLVVTFGAELFTGNNAVLMPGMFRKRYGFWPVIGNWTVVWLGNFAGALLFTYFLAIAAGVFDAAPYDAALTGIAVKKCSLDGVTCFLRGIGANWCVCLAVWLAIGAKTFPGKVVACFLPVGVFVALGYEHCIANMFFIPGGMMLGAPVSYGMLGANLAMSTLGNIAGGALFVGCLNYWLHRDA